MAGIISNFESLKNIEAERAILGAIILDEKIIVNCIDGGLKKSDFQGAGYGELYDVMIGLHKNNTPIEIISIVEEYKKIGFSIETSILTDMTNRTIPGNSKYYIAQIKDKSFKKKIYDNTVEFINSIVTSDNSEIKTKLEELERSFDISSSVESMFLDASSIKRVDLNSGLETGFGELDKALNGLVFGSLTILTGEPSSGKSTLLNQIIAQNVKNGHRCLLYSGELTGFNVLQWFMRTVANVNDLKKFNSSVGEYYDVTSHGENLIRKWIENKLYIFSEEASPSISNLINTIEFLARTRNLKLVILDNLMTVENGDLEEYEKQKTLVKKLKAVAKKYRICVILVAHPKKKLNGEKKYHMHDVSGASEVVNLADYELLLTRDISIDSGGKRTDITKIGVLKNRITGKQGISKQLNFDTTRKRFWMDKSELNRDYEYDKLDQINFVSINNITEEVPF